MAHLILDIKSCIPDTSCPNPLDMSYSNAQKHHWNLDKVCLWMDRFFWFMVEFIVIWGTVFIILVYYHSQEYRASFRTIHTWWVFHYLLHY